MLKGVYKRSVLFSILIFIFSVFITDSTFAESVDYNVSVSPALTLTVPSSPIVLNLDPAAKPFDSHSFSAVVGTNNKTGYVLTLSTPNDNTDLSRDTSSDNLTGAIQTLDSGTYSESNFTANKWGYKLNDATDYIPFASGTTIMQSDSAVNHDEATITLASKVDYSQPAGTYSTTLNFNIVANPPIYYMQDLNPTMCTTDAPLTVVDQRDGKEYTVQRLADGQCWMTSNLNLTGGTKLYSETSNVPAGYPSSGNIPYYTLPTSPETPGASDFSNDTVAYTYNSGNETTDQADCYDNHPCNSYYSWLAATAGGKNANGEVVTGNGIDAPYSICPKGWRLPKSGAAADTSAISTVGYKKGDFYKLATAYGADLESSFLQNSATFYNNAGPGTTPNFLIAGDYLNDGETFSSVLGRYWSSSASYDDTKAYALRFDSSHIQAANNATRRTGYAVRCILSTPIDSLSTMQDFASLSAEEKTNLISLMPTERNYTLTDARDGKGYTIAKLKDGNIWMTSNLNLAGGTYLYSEDSDIPAGYTRDHGPYFQLPASSTSGFSSDSGEYVYNSGNETTNCTSSTPCNSYYSWLVATVGGIDASGNAVTGDGPDAAYSICPKGWRLPKSGNQSDTSATSTTGYKKGDFYKLITAYGVNLESFNSEKILTFHDNAGPGTLPNFLLAGDYSSSSTFTDGGAFGSYWSSSSKSSTIAYNLRFSNSYGDQYVYSADWNNRRFGFAVRCLLR